jgi:hypothetical protein
MRAHTCTYLGRTDGALVKATSNAEQVNLVTQQDDGRCVGLGGALDLSYHHQVGFRALERVTVGHRVHHHECLHIYRESRPTRGVKPIPVVSCLFNEGDRWARVNLAKAQDLANERKELLLACGHI